MATTGKRFPADTALDIETFLNDKNINGELYAYLQSQSKPIENEQKIKETIVIKKDLPNQQQICEKIGIKARKTLRTHLNYLIERGYVVDRGKTYYLPNKEDIYFMIPLDTLNYLNDNCREHVFKIYIYLGQRYKYALSRGTQYEFTLEELGQHIGIKIKNYARGYEIVNNALTLLKNSGLIEYCEYFDGKSLKKKLTKFSYDFKR